MKQYLTTALENLQAAQKQIGDLWEQHPESRKNRTADIVSLLGRAESKIKADLRDIGKAETQVIVTTR